MAPPQRGTSSRALAVAVLCSLLLGGALASRLPGQALGGQVGSKTLLPPEVEVGLRGRLPDLSAGSADWGRASHHFEHFDHETGLHTHYSYDARLWRWALLLDADPHVHGYSCDFEARGGNQTELTVVVDAAALESHGWAKPGAVLVGGGACAPLPLRLAGEDTPDQLHLRVVEQLRREPAAGGPEGAVRVTVLAVTCAYTEAFERNKLKLYRGKATPDEFGEFVDKAFEKKGESRAKCAGGGDQDGGVAGSRSSSGAVLTPSALPGAEGVEPAAPAARASQTRGPKATRRSVSTPRATSPVALGSAGSEWERMQFRRLLSGGQNLYCNQVPTETLGDSDLSTTRTFQESYEGNYVVVLTQVYLHEDGDSLTSSDMYAKLGTCTNYQSSQCTLDFTDMSINKGTWYAVNNYLGAVKCGSKIRVQVRESDTVWDDIFFDKWFDTKEDFTDGESILVDNGKMAMVLRCVNCFYEPRCDMDSDKSLKHLRNTDYDLKDVIGILKCENNKDSCERKDLNDQCRAAGFTRMCDFEDVYDIQKRTDYSTPASVSADFKDKCDNHKFMMGRTATLGDGFGVYECTLDGCAGATSIVDDTDPDDPIQCANDNSGGYKPETYRRRGYRRLKWVFEKRYTEVAPQSTMITALSAFEVLYGYKAPQDYPYLALAYIDINGWLNGYDGASCDGGDTWSAPGGTNTVNGILECGKVANLETNKEQRGYGYCDRNFVTNGKTEIVYQTSDRNCAFNLASYRINIWAGKSSQYYFAPLKWKVYGQRSGSKDWDLLDEREYAAPPPQTSLSVNAQQLVAVSYPLNILAEKPTVQYPLDGTKDSTDRVMCCGIGPASTKGTTTTAKQDTIDTADYTKTIEAKSLWNYDPDEDAAVEEIPIYSANGTTAGHDWTSDLTCKDCYLKLMETQMYIEIDVDGTYGFKSFKALATGGAKLNLDFEYVFTLTADKSEEGTIKEPSFIFQYGVSIAGVSLALGVKFGLDWEYTYTFDGKVTVNFGAEATESVALGLHYVDVCGFETITEFDFDWKTHKPKIKASADMAADFTLMPKFQLGAWAGSQVNTGVSAYVEVRAKPYTAAEMMYKNEDISGEDFNDGFDKPLYSLSGDLGIGVDCTEAHDLRLGVSVGMHPPDVAIFLRAALGWAKNPENGDDADNFVGFLWKQEFGPWDIDSLEVSPYYLMSGCLNLEGVKKEDTEGAAASGDASAIAVTCVAAALVVLVAGGVQHYRKKAAKRKAAEAAAGGAPVVVVELAPGQKPTPAEVEAAAKVLRRAGVDRVPPAGGPAGAPAPATAHYNPTFASPPGDDFADAEDDFESVGPHERM